MPRTAKPPSFEIVHCTHCGKQHIDENTPEFAYAEKNHSRHWCIDDAAGKGCRKFFFTKSNIGVKSLPAERVGA